MQKKTKLELLGNLVHNKLRHENECNQMTILADAFENKVNTTELV